MVEVKEVSLRFKSVWALKPVSFTVNEGDVFCLVGSDGAGKSTLLRLIAGLIRPTEGKILAGGLDVTARKTDIKHLIGYMPQRFGLYTDLTVEENMDFFLDVFEVPRHQRRKRKERYLSFSNLLPFADRPAGLLSGGMKQKLGLACVLSHEPKLLILDEPTNGVDPVSRSEFWEILFRMKASGMTILVSTAYLDEAERCDQAALLHRGVLLALQTPAGLREGFDSLEEAVISRIIKADKEPGHDVFIV
jgi:ABC-2 type transport system ATP-binding protein